MEVHSDRELQHLQEQVRRAAHLTRTRLETLNLDSMGALYTLKFEECGYHPVSGHQLNLIEQLNQTFTVMAALAAARFCSSGFMNLNWEDYAFIWLHSREGYREHQSECGGGGGIHGSASK